MNKIHEWVNTGLLIAIVAILVLVGGNQSGQVPNTYGNAGTRFPHGVSINTATPPSSNGFIIGDNGSEITGLNMGTCYIAPYASTIAASSTVVVDCQGTAGWDAAGDTVTGSSALSGVVSGDVINAFLATSTAGVYGGIHIAGGIASSTAGHIELRITNFTGTTYTWPTTGTASGTAYFVAKR